MFDAHCHLHVAEVPGGPQGAFHLAMEAGLQGMVVNATCEDDWMEVLTFCQSSPALYPAIGIHPWKADQASKGWEARLSELLRSNPSASVGEAGLDGCLENISLELQEEVFRKQLRLARSFNRPITIHCVRAWGALQRVLESEPPPAAGVLLHGYGGSVELIPVFCEMGCYFSFSSYIGDARRSRLRDGFLAVPEERLLLESDAPDMSGPLFLLSTSQAALSQPADLRFTLPYLAAYRNLSRRHLAEVTAGNAQRLFGLQSASASILY